MPIERLLASRGFTLAELLIALSILGVIAAFSVGPILENAQQRQWNTRLKGAVSAVHAVLYGAYRSLNVNTDTDLTSYVRENLNHRRFCAGHARDQGCWQTGASLGGSELDDSISAILPDGTYVVGMSAGYNDPTPTAALDLPFVIDANGPSLPNEEGRDQLRLSFCFNPVGCVTGTWAGNIRTFYSGAAGLGTLFPYNAESATLFVSLSQ